MPHPIPRVLTLLALLCSAAAARSQDLVAATDPLSAEEQQKRFHLPPGFEIQLVAAEPEIRKPMNLSFDDRGRLFVTQSIEYPFPAAAGTPARDQVLIFEDADQDGRAERVSSFTGGLNIPIGVTPVPGGVLYFSIPNIYFGPDADGDDRADGQELFYHSVGTADTHGMSNSYRRWIDGWIYGCHGFANQSTIQGRDGQPITMHSGNTYRLRADGSHIEYHTHGQVNPFGLCFDPLGNLYSSDCHTLPLYTLLRGAYYPSFGKPHDGLGFGPTMLSHLHGSTGIAGVVYYAADHFPPEFRDTVFIGNPVTGRVNHDRLEAHGSSYTALEQPDFISCDDPWFRPVDLALAPDGSLYIADFYNCIIGHYEVPLTHPRRDRERGRIWRVVWRGTEGKAPAPRPMPNLKQTDLDGLIALLSEANLSLRVLATEQIVTREGAAAVPKVAQVVDRRDSPATARAHGLWILQRLGALDATRQERLAADPDRLVRVHLVKALAERDDWGTDPTSLPRRLALAALTDADPWVRRAAADALGRHPVPETVRPLLELWSNTPADDTHLIHAARIALRDHLLVPGMYATLSDLLVDEPRARQLADVSLGVRNAESAAWLLAILARVPVDRELMGAYLHGAARYIAPDQLPSVYAFAESFESVEPLDQLTMLRALHQAAQERNDRLPSAFVAWGMRLARQLLAADAEATVREGIELARMLGEADLFAPVAAWAAQESRWGNLRPAAIDALIAIDGPRAATLLGERLSDSTEPLAIRQKCAAALGAINADESRAELLRQLPTAPERLGIEIAAGLSSTPAGAEGLLAAVEAGKASPRLLQEPNVRNRLRGLRQAEIERRLEALVADLPPRENRLNELIDTRREGFAQAKTDAAAGERAFRKVCAACHKLGGEGAKIGPELDGIGVRGLDRILEDVLDPNRNVDQAFRSTVLATSDGRTLTGLALRDEGGVLVLADTQGKELRVPLADIAEREISPLSPMPANVPDLLSEQEFYDLAAYLLSQKQLRAEPSAAR